MAAEAAHPKAKPIFKHVCFTDNPPLTNLQTRLCINRPGLRLPQQVNRIIIHLNQNRMGKSTHILTVLCQEGLTRRPLQAERPEQRRSHLLVAPFVEDLGG